MARPKSRVFRVADALVSIEKQMEALRSAYPDLRKVSADERNAIKAARAGLEEVRVSLQQALAAEAATSLRRQPRKRTPEPRVEDVRSQP